MHTSHLFFSVSFTRFECQFAANGINETIRGTKKVEQTSVIGKQGLLPLTKSSLSFRLLQSREKNSRQARRTYDGKGDFKGLEVALTTDDTLFLDPMKFVFSNAFQATPHYLLLTAVT